MISPSLTPLSIFLGSFKYLVKELQTNVIVLRLSISSTIYLDRHVAHKGTLLFELTKQKGANSDEQFDESEQMSENTTFL